MTEYVTGQIYGWNGGECPVHPETQLKIWTRNSLFCSELTTLAKSCFWDHVQHPRDIVCFQVVTPYVEPQPPAIDPAAIREAALQDRIKELVNSLAWYKMMDAMSSDHVVELTDKLEAAEAKLTKAVAFIRRHIPDSVYEQRQRANAFLAELEKTE